MTERLTSQLERLSYTRRDLELIDEEIDRFIVNFIPVIKNTSKANVGRILLRIIEGLVDKLNYSMDMRFRQSVLRTVKELQSAIDITELVRYKPAGVSSATADLTVSTLTGPATSGGISIAQYSKFSTSTAPTKRYISLEAATVPEGATSLYPLKVVQGLRRVGSTILSSATGEPAETVKFVIAKTPYEYIEIQVDGNDFEQKVDLRESEPNDRHYYLTTDEDSFVTVHFGDGTYGTTLAPSAVVTATFIQSLGEDGNTPKETITGVVGSLSSQISVTHDEVASGGSDGDIVEDIVRKAPLQSTTSDRASNERDFEALATRVDGVFQALADLGVGPLVTLSVMPTGGGVASSTLLTAVEEEINPLLIHGASVVAKPLISAHIYMKMDVLLLTNKINKSLARKSIFEAISAFKLSGEVNEDGALYYRNLKIGRGFALSDVSSIVESVQDGELIDFVNYKIFSRYPSPISNGITTSIEFDGEIVPNAVAVYDSWSVQADNTTEFKVYKNGVYDSTGSVGVQHTTADGSLTFSLGLTTDTFVGGEQWVFESSAYRNNMKLSRLEFMELASDSDLDIAVFFPGELEIGD